MQPHCFSGASNLPARAPVMTVLGAAGGGGVVSGFPAALSPGFTWIISFPFHKKPLSNDYAIYFTAD